MTAIIAIESSGLPELLPWAQRYYLEDHLPFSGARFLRALSTAMILGRGSAFWITAQSQRVGYLIALDGWSIEYGGLTVELDELFIAPQARGQRHASLAIEALLGVCRQRGVVFLGMETTPDNTRAAALYQRLGFAGTDRPTFRKFLRHD